MTGIALRIGQTVQCQDGRQGTVRYIGTLHIAAGDWVGLELPDGSGKNDGSVKGERYFQCNPGYGIFVRKESVANVIKQPAPTARASISSASTNGVGTKARPSTGAVPDATKKRQSLIGGASAATSGSRLSIWSPTRSPTKPAHSSTSSNTPTPRTGTPATSIRTTESTSKPKLSTSGRTSMGPPAGPAKPPAHGGRLSLNIQSSKSIVTRPSGAASRQSLATSKSLLQSKPAPQNLLRPESKVTEQDRVIKSPTIVEEEGEDTASNPDDGQTEVSNDGDAGSAVEVPTKVTDALHHSDVPRSRTVSISDAVVDNVEAKTAAKREVEQFKATIRTLEKKILENRDKLKSVDALQVEKDRFEGIIQALQKKLKANQQEMSDLRAKYEAAEAQADTGPDRSAEHESEMELAALDREMAEERAEIYQAELEALKTRHEELELEAEILREENRELGSIMSPEDKAAAGWLQMEREQERLRQALRLLRDVSQQNENDLRHEVKELQETLEDAEKIASLYEEAAEKLARIEENNRHLKEQLEAAEANDEVFEAMEAQREHDGSTIEQLKKQIQDLEEHVQVTDELEAFHIEEEKRLHSQLDQSDALMNDKQRQVTEQQKVVEDLEYTLTKFRNVVQGLQSDIDELRRSRDINEQEAHEMSSKSRAMMELNLQLQSSAVKTQLKTIDLEMGKMDAEQASLHLEIVQLFVPDTIEAERSPIFALLCFKRIMAKASIVQSILIDRMRDRSHLTEDDPFTVFEISEGMKWIALCCHKFITFMSSSSPEDFMSYSGAPFELEPVERCITGWVDALRRDELGSEGAEHIQRMVSILSDMSEKLIPENSESKITEMVTQSSMIEYYGNSIAFQLAVIAKSVQAKLGRGNDDGDYNEDAMLFDQKVEQFGTRARTIKYLAGKVVRTLSELRSRSVCPSETTWVFFEDAEEFAHNVCKLVRTIGRASSEQLQEVELESDVTFSSVVGSMTDSAHSYIYATNGNKPNDDMFGILSGLLQSLQSRVDDLINKAADTTSITEFEVLPAPWLIRAKEIKAQKIISQDVRDELTRLKARAQEQVTRLSEKDKIIEEQKIRVDVLESRSKETKTRDENMKAMKEEIERLQNEKSSSHAAVERLQSEYQALVESSENTRSELTKLKELQASDKGISVPASGSTAMSPQFKLEVDLLKTEMASLQSTVRYLKRENHGLRIPVSEAAITSVQHAWLNPLYLCQPKKRDVRAETLRRDGSNVLTGLMELAKSAKPIALKSRTSPHLNTLTKGHEQSRSLRTPLKDYTSRYEAAKQQEELEQWLNWKDDLLRKARIGSRGLQHHRNGHLVIQSNTSTIETS